jgi:hypothetical protein
MHRTRLLSALAAPLLLITLTACGGGGDDSEADVKAKVADQLVDSGLDQEAADCLAGVFVEEIGVDGMKDIDFSSDEPPAGLEDEFAGAALKGISDCEIDIDALDG